MEYIITTPPTYLDPLMNDTYLRFSIMASLETKINSQWGFILRRLCIPMELEVSQSGLFEGEDSGLIEPLSINIPLSWN